MAMFDFLRIDTSLPDQRVRQDESFQTWSLFQSVEHFTITRHGRLLHHPCSSHVGRSGSSAIPCDDGSMDMNFHGELLFCGISVQGGHAYYKARFTDGTLDWIRPARIAEQPYRGQRPAHRDH